MSTSNDATLLPLLTTHHDGSSRSRRRSRAAASSPVSEDEAFTTRMAHSDSDLAGPSDSSTSRRRKRRRVEDFRVSEDEGSGNHHALNVYESRGETSLQEASSSMQDPMPPAIPLTNLDDSTQPITDAASAIAIPDADPGDEVVIISHKPRQDSIDSIEVLDEPSASSTSNTREPLATYTCPICFFPPTNATLTPCGHVCCGQCLFTAVKATMRRNMLAAMDRAPAPRYVYPEEQRLSSDA